MMTKQKRLNGQSSAFAMHSRRGVKRIGGGASLSRLYLCLGSNRLEGIRKNSLLYWYMLKKRIKNSFGYKNKHRLKIVKTMT